MKTSVSLPPDTTPHSTALGIALVNAQGTILGCNRLFRHFAMAASQDELTGVPLPTLVADPQSLQLAITRALENETTVSGQYQLVPRPGLPPVPYQLDLIPLEKHQGEPVAALVSLRPVGQTAVAAEAPACPRVADTMEPVHRAQSLPELLEAALDALGQLTPLYVALAVVRDPETGDHAQAARRLPAELWPDMAHLLLETLRPPASGVVSSCAELVNIRAATEPDWPLAVAVAFRALEVHTAARLSILREGQPCGVVLLGFAQQPPLPPTLRETLDVFAAQLSHATTDLLVRTATEQEATGLDKLLEVALALNVESQLADMLQLIAHAALDVASGHCCRIDILDEEHLRFEHSYFAARDDSRACRDPEPDAKAWEVITSGELLVIEPSQETASPAHGPSALVPLNLDHHAIGVLSLRRQSGTGFRACELRALRLLSAQAAAAVRNARLHEVAKRRSEHMEMVATQAWQEEARARTLFQVAAAVTDKTDLHDILTDVAGAVCAGIGFERVRVYLADHEHQVLHAELEMHAGGEPVSLEDEVVPLRVGQGNRLAEAALSSAPYLIETVEETRGDETVQYERLLVPMVAQNMLVGVIAADNFESRADISLRQTPLLRELAGLASVAIERARIDKLRGALISAVSHELRAPLASIRAYNELVLSGDTGPITDEQRTCLERVDRAAGTLERLINDLMNLSKLRAGQFTVTRQPTHVNTLIRSVLDVMRPKAEAAQVSLECELTGELPEILTDQGRVEQVLINLVDNAIKFNNPGGWVRVTAQLQDDHILFAVADNGPGIPKSYQNIIFEEFAHGTDSVSRAKKGAGLGLAIARRVTEVLGGEMWVESELGKGSTFYCSLPITPLPGQGQPHQDLPA